MKTLLVGCLFLGAHWALALTPMESWRQVNFGTTLNVGSAADDADPDHDGLANLAEAGLGRNPQVADSAGVTIPSLISGVSGIAFEQVKSITDVDLVPLVSTNLKHWRSGAAFLSTTQTNDLGAKVALRSALVSNTQSPVFFRLFPVRPSQAQLTATLAAQSNAPDDMLARCGLPSGPRSTHPFSGALTIYPVSYTVAEPWLDWYFCNLALCEFVSSHPSLVKNYIECYLAYVDELDAVPGWNSRIKRVKLNKDGITVQSFHDADSDDAYASTLVRLACLYRKANAADQAWFLSILPKLKALIYRNVLTQVKPNGLAKAKQTGYDFGLLEDNVENWAGLKELSEALVVVGDLPSEISFYSGWRDAILNATHSQLWDPVAKAWKWNDGASGAEHAKFFEDVHCQIFPELFDMPHPSGAAETQSRYDTAWAYLNLHQPNWWTDVWGAEPYSHLDLAVVASKRGEKDRARQYLELALTRYIPIGNDTRGTIITEIAYWKRLLTE